MPLIESFDAIIPAEPQILILGSMPSARSLATEQYYAHPYNAFWPILAQIFQAFQVSKIDSQKAPEPLWSLGQHHKIPFAEKQALLERTNIALWDVFATCERKNSADSSIKAPSLNPIAELLHAQQGIQTILLNGQTSSSAFRQKVLPKIQNLEARHNLPAERNLKAEHNLKAGQNLQQKQLLTLPSTSPAYAAMPFAKKLEIWRQALLNSAI